MPGKCRAADSKSRRSRLSRMSRQPQLALLGEATLLSLHNDAPRQKRQECRFPDSRLQTSRGNNAPPEQSPQCRMASCPADPLTARSTGARHSRLEASSTSNQPNSQEYLGRTGFQPVHHRRASWRPFERARCPFSQYSPAPRVPARFRAGALLGEATLLSLHNDAPMQKRQECHES